LERVPPEKGQAVLSVEDLRKRVDRLKALSKGLAKECVLIRAAQDPLLYLERKAYLNRLADAIAGAEARVTLGKALARMRDGGRDEAA
jgi:hypothetical protein